MSLGPLMVDIDGTALDEEDRAVLSHPLVGSVILFTRNYRDPDQLTRLVADIHALRTPALLVAVDHEGGRVQRFRTGFTALPAVRLIGHTWDLERVAALQLARQHGWMMAAELRAVGIDFSFAPCVDLDYGLSSVIGDRAWHSRAAAVGELGVAYMHGMRDAGMAAVAKHFPGHGAVVADSHLTVPVDRRNFADLSDDLDPYRVLIANGLPAVMMAHVLYPAVDQHLASCSTHWIQGVLRGDLHFKGTIFSDDLSMKGAAAAGDIVARVAASLAAGCDVLPVCNDRASVRRLLQECRAAPDPALHLRLARLRGKPHADRAALQASASWQRCRAALAACGAPPPLELGGAA